MFQQRRFVHRIWMPLFVLILCLSLTAASSQMVSKAAALHHFSHALNSAPLMAGTVTEYSIPLMAASRWGSRAGQTATSGLRRASATPLG
jgi:hypothetical protein